MKYTFLATIIVLALPLVALANTDLPVDGVITSGVGWRIDPFGTGKLVFHRGIDIAVPVGTPVHATRSGRVVLAGEHRGHGATVILEHENGDRTLYGHNSLVRVHVGEVVQEGDVIAFSGSTGRSTGPHVHFEKIPSGRPVTETIAVGQLAAPQLAAPLAAAPQFADDSQQRRLLEQKMEESVNSILRAIKGSSVVEQGG